MPLRFCLSVVALALVAAGCPGGDAKVSPDLTSPADLVGADLTSSNGDAAALGDLANADLAGADLASPDLHLACTLSTECTSPAAPVCGVDHVCRACSGGAEDSICVAAGQKRCITNGPATGACGACNPTTPDHQNADCAAATPVCTGAGVCAPCTAHDQCGSGICLGDGTCAATSDVAYVGITDCNDNTTDSTVHPFCSIGKAATEKTLIRVAGSATPYPLSPLEDASGSLLIVGPGVSASPTARIFDPDLELGVSVTFTGSATDDFALTLAGVEVGGTVAKKPQNAVYCKNNMVTQTLAITLVDSLVDASVAAGIESSNCRITVRRTAVTGNGTDGIHAVGGAARLVVQESAVTQNGTTGMKLALADYTVENSLFAENGGVGIVFDGSTPLGTSRFWFNTVVHNGIVDAAGGLNCGSLGGTDQRAVAYSIVALNTTTAASPTQLVNADKCAFTSVVAGTVETSSATGLIALTPAFVAPMPMEVPMTPQSLLGDFSLLASDTVAKDTVDPGSDLPLIDVFSTPRPQGTKLDIGMHEVAP